MRIVFAGTPEFAVPALRALLGSSHAVVGVLTQPDRPSGRGRRLTASPVKLAALQAGVPVDQPAGLREEVARRSLMEWRPDVMVVVAYGLILPREVLALLPLGCLNIHASLLPRWRGAAPIQRAVLAGDCETGVTIMQMEAGLDTGPMLIQAREPIGPDDTSGTLHERLAQKGAAALMEALVAMEQGSIQARPQPADGVTYAAKIEKAEARIDWGCDAVDIERKVRAFNPWPIAETRLDGEQLRIGAARLPRSGNESAEGEGIDPLLNQSGLMEGVEPDGIRVRCGRGTLTVTEVQRPGKRPVAARDFARSCDVIGRRLG
jgi:methionyl-tRNA formyltransferase